MLVCGKDQGVFDAGMKALLRMAPTDQAWNTEHTVFVSTRMHAISDQRLRQCEDVGARLMAVCCMQFAVARDIGAVLDPGR